MGGGEGKGGRDLLHIVSQGPRMTEVLPLGHHHLLRQGNIDTGALHTGMSWSQPRFSYVSSAYISLAGVSHGTLNNEGPRELVSCMPRKERSHRFEEAYF